MCSKGSYLWNREVCGILNVSGLLINLRECRVHALVFTAGLAVLLWSRLLWRGAPFGLAVHRRWEHLQGKSMRPKRHYCTTIKNSQQSCSYCGKIQITACTSSKLALELWSISIDSDRPVSCRMNNIMLIFCKLLFLVALHNSHICLQRTSIFTLLPASCSLRSDSSDGSSLGERGRCRWESEARSPREISVHM